ncbi:MAG TPA: ABC transporter permease [Dehalococcoidia bacterium]|nr:ABC transporter permease [Dehalococcoidia bacterium]
MAKETTLELQGIAEAPNRAPRWVKILRLARAHPLGALGLLCVIGIVACAVLADYIVPNDPEAIQAGPIREGPTVDNIMGTDRLGRDVASRTIFGARIAMLIGITSVTLGMIMGSLIGIVSGYFGGFVDALIQRAVDALLAFPAVVLLLAIIAVIGDESSPLREFIRDYTFIPEGTVWGVPNFLDIFVISIGIGIAIAVGVARVIRGAVLSLKENVYIEAAQAMGASDWRIMRKHILPNVAALIVVLGTIFLPIAILAEAAISFLGIGVPQGTPSWGADMSGPNRDDAINRGVWWVVFFPGLALSLVVLGFNLLGDSFRDISDPRLRGSGGSRPGL